YDRFDVDSGRSTRGARLYAPSAGSTGANSSKLTSAAGRRHLLRGSQSAHSHATGTLAERLAPQEFRAEIERRLTAQALASRKVSRVSRRPRPREPQNRYGQRTEQDPYFRKQ